MSKVLKSKAFIGLGSNLQNPVAQINLARRVIAESEGVIEKGFSDLYASPPMGSQDQPDYVNAVMGIETALDALVLLALLQQIEQQQGRIRNGQRWGARTLDLDLLLYDDQVINFPNLIVPHPGIAERAFVLYPLRDIAPPNLMVPGQGELQQLLSVCALNGLEKLPS